MNNKELYELTEAEFSLLVYGVIDYFDASIAFKTEEVYRLREELNYENRDIIRAYIYKVQEEINDLIAQRGAFLDKIGYNDTELASLYSVLPEEDEVYGTFYDKQGLKDFLNKYYRNDVKSVGLFNKVLKEEFLDIYKRLDKPSKEEKREAYMGAIYKTEEKLGYQLQNIPSNKRMIKIIQKQVDFEKKAKKKIKNK